MKTFLLLVAAAVAGVAGVSPIAQQRRAMTIDDLIVAPRIADPQLSPDGRTVLFVQTTTDGRADDGTLTSGACRAMGPGSRKP